MNTNAKDLAAIKAIVEQLLVLVELQAETALADMKSRQRFRHEVLARLDPGASTPTESNEDPALVRKSDAIKLAKAVAPYLLSLLTAASGWVWHFLHPGV